MSRKEPDKLDPMEMTASEGQRQAEAVEDIVRCDRCRAVMGFVPWSDEAVYCLRCCKERSKKSG